MNWNKMHARIKEIAGNEGVMTLEVRKSDILDFHDLHVESIYRMLEAAYRSGYSSGVADARGEES